MNARLLNLLKMPRLLRIGRILKYLDNLSFAKMIRILKLFVYFFLFDHWLKFYNIKVKIIVSSISISIFFYSNLIKKWRINRFENILY